MGDVVVTEEVAAVELSGEADVSMYFGEMADDELFGNEEKAVVVKSDKKSGSETKPKEDKKGSKEGTPDESLKKEDIPKEKKADKSQKKDFTFDKDAYLTKTPEELVAELEKAQKEAHGQKSLLGKHGKELGDFKKENDRLQKEIESLQQKILSEDQLSELEIESPRKAAKAERESEEATKEILNLKRQQAIQNNQALVLNDMPDFEDHVEAIAAIIKEDGEPEAAKAFKNNPYMILPAVSMNLYKRAQMANQINEIKGEYEKQMSEMQAKYDKLLNNTRHVTQSIKKSAKHAALGNLPSDSNDKKLISVMDVALMSDAELDE